MTRSVDTDPRLPDFFIVGHPKSGTTALYEMLRCHPQIYMPALKEPRFFASDLRSHSQEPAATRFPQTLEEYLLLFADAKPEQCAGEASPLYLMSRTAARLISDVQPAARIVAVLREPASFVRSMHMQFVQDRVEVEKDLRKAVANEDLTLPGRQRPRDVPEPLALRYSDRVRYVEQLRRYHAAFAPEQVLVLIYDDFKRDNEGTVRAVLRFLDVEDTGPVHVTQANPTVHVRSQRLDRIVRALYAGKGPVPRTAKRTIKTVTPKDWHGDGLQAIRRRVVYGAPRAPDETFMWELRSRFKPEVAELSDYLGRDLVTLWGYDRIG